MDTNMKLVQVISADLTSVWDEKEHWPLDLAQKDGILNTWVFAKEQSR